MWMGRPKNESNINAEIPAWSFLIDDEQEVPKLKGVLTKVIFETNMGEDIERSMERDDHQYLENQVLGDQEKDIDMEGIYKIEDFDFMGYEAAEVDQDESESEEEEKESLRKPKNQLGFVEEDEDDENSESVQAQSYDRTFIVSGPVVKVYRKAEADEGRSLAFDMSLPILKNDQGDKLNP